MTAIMTRTARRSTRPAVIRPVPASFGAGILLPAEVAPVTAAVAPAPVVNLDDPAPYANGWTPELAKARLAAITARMNENIASIDAQIEAGTWFAGFPTPAPAVACEECLDDDQTDVEADPAGFADELVEAVARPRSKFHPSATDRAWELGYSLGRDGIAAASYHSTHGETMAFLAGHDRGLAAYQDDQRDEVEAVISAWEADHGHEEHEMAYAGSCVGHLA